MPRSFSGPSSGALLLFLGFAYPATRSNTKFLYCPAYIDVYQVGDKQYLIASKALAEQASWFHVGHTSASNASKIAPGGHKFDSLMNGP